MNEAKEMSLEMLTFPSLFAYKNAKDAYDFVTSVVNEPEIKFLIEKIGNQFDLYKSDLAKEEVLKKAFNIANRMKNNYIREMDLFIAYFLLIEDKAKIFEKSDLKEDDVINLLNWARHKFVPKKEKFLDVEFTGSGVFDFFVFGWNYETRKYARDFTMDVMSEKYEPIAIGREEECGRFLSSLGKDKTNSVILVGEAGTGKTTLVEYFAYYSHLGKLPPEVSFRRVFELFVDRVLSGVQNQGELEERIGYLLEDIYHSGNTIVFIQNIENIFGGGGFNFDLSGVVFEYLKSSKIQIIGTTTKSVYKTQLENRDDVKQFFDVIELEEPNEKETLFMLFEKIGQLEDEYGVSYTYNAIEQAVMLSSSYLIDRYLPGKAIDLLESVASDVRIKGKSILIDKDDIIKKIEEKTKVVIAAPTEEEKKVLLNLEEEIHKRIIDQEEAVKAVAGSIRRLRSGFSNKKRPISVFLFLGPTGVGKTEMAKALASTYFGDEKRMIRLDMSEFQTQDSIKRLLGSLPGETYSPSQFIEEVKDNPFSLILLDEFEKAHSRILDVFLQVFDDGRLTDNAGRTIPFTSTIIIATSNAGSEMIRQKVKIGEDIVKIKPEILDQLQKEEKFRPELLNRFDDIIIFKPLGEDEIRKIANLQLFSVLKPLEEKSIYLSYDQKIIDKVSTEGFDIEFGARNVRRYIQSNIENMVSKMILQNQIKKGDRKTLSVDGEGNIVIV